MTLRKLAAIGFAAAMAHPASADVTIVDASDRAVVRYAASHALLLGVSDYTAGWSDLPSVPSELAAVRNALELHGFEVTAHLDLDEAELRAAVESFIDHYGYNADNRLLIYFAGHGHSRTVGGAKRGYLVPGDAPLPRTGKAQAFLRKAVPMTQVMSWARQIEARHALFVFDSCFSGMIFDTRSGPPDPAHITSRTGRPVRQFLTAGRAGERVPARSRFTPAFVRALTTDDADLTGDGYVTGDELGLFLHDEIAGTGQTPQYGKLADSGMREGDFVFQLPAELPTIPVAIGDALELKADREAERLPKAGEPWTDPAVGMKFRYAPAGTFDMGSPTDEPKHAHHERLHTVTLTRGFWIGETEVTQGQWRRVFGNEPAHFTACDECPIESVNWYEAIAYANELSKRAKFEPCYQVSGGNGRRAGKDLVYGSVVFRGFDCTGYRLPSEAEWEYAARAGTSSAFWFGEEPTTEIVNSNGGWYLTNSIGEPRRETAPVRTYPPNRWGLFEVHGNVAEWCQDAATRGIAGTIRTGPYLKEVVDPLGYKGSFRVVRGGGWSSLVSMCRSASRFTSMPAHRFHWIGFRLVRTHEPAE